MTNSQLAYLTENAAPTIWPSTAQTPEQVIEAEATMTLYLWALDGPPPAPTHEDVAAFIRANVASGVTVVEPPPPLPERRR
jgi:hypothetical protein